MNILKSFLVGLIGMLLGAGFGAACAPTPTPFSLPAAIDQYLSQLPDDWGILSATALNDQLKSSQPFLVDVREAKEIADAGFIAGSINLPVRSFIKNLDKLPAKDQPIVVICGSGHRSAMAMAALQLLGYSHVASLASGFAAWKAAGMSIASGVPPEANPKQAPATNPELTTALDKYFSALPDGWGTIAPAALNEMLRSSRPFQLDVRESKEISDIGFIEGATKISIRTLVKNLGQLPPDRGAPIIIDCSIGHRSAIAMMALNLLGYTNSRSLAGGIAAWTKAGFPVSK
jgi:rhodanese-related sulfurtransferase